MKLGEVINRLIKNKGLTQVEVAKKIGKSTTALSQIVRGTYNPSPATLEKLAEVLETPLPILYFLSITEDDIPEDKKDLYNILAPSIKEFIVKIFGSDKKDLVDVGLN
tara:strand:- start:392 stop:715 length:324 start_codon:yes stop_codon:yes gene_type:complete